MVVVASTPCTAMTATGVLAPGRRGALGRRGARVDAVPRAGAGPGLGWDRAAVSAPMPRPAIRMIRPTASQPSTCDPVAENAIQTPRPATASAKWLKTRPPGLRRRCAPLAASQPASRYAPAAAVDNQAASAARRSGRRRRRPGGRGGGQRRPGRPGAAEQTLEVNAVPDGQAARDGLGGRPDGSPDRPRGGRVDLLIGQAGTGRRPGGHRDVTLESTQAEGVAGIDGRPVHGGRGRRAAGR